MKECFNILGLRYGQLWARNHCGTSFKCQQLGCCKRVESSWLKVRFLWPFLKLQGKTLKVPYTSPVWGSKLCKFATSKDLHPPWMLLQSPSLVLPTAQLSASCPAPSAALLSDLVHIYHCAACPFPVTACCWGSCPTLPLEPSPLPVSPWHTSLAGSRVREQ